MKNIYRSLVIFALVLATISLHSQQLDPSLYSALHWRMIGPFRGGRVLAVSGVPGQPETFYFGAVAGGIWKTTDGGEIWSPIFDQQPIASIGALAVAPSDPNIIYAGSGEADMRSNITFGDGVYKSTDAGKTWKNVGLRDSRQIGRIIIDPHDANVVFVAALGHAYGPNTERGIFRTTDGGATWQKVLYKDENTGAIDLCFDPQDSKVIYAALWQVRRPPWSVYPPTSGPGSGLYKSSDGGTTWHEFTGHGLPVAPWGRIGIDVAPNDSNRIYALIDSNKNAGLYRSDDAGENWQLVGSDERIHERAWYFSGVTVDPSDPNSVYVSNVSLYHSKDGGKNFEAIKGAPGGDDYHILWIDPHDPRRMILGCDQGAAISVDSGQTWSSWYNQPTAQFYRVATDNQFPYHVYGAQQDSGTAETTSRSDFGEITFRDWHPVGGGESGYIAPDPSDPNIVYAGDTYGTLWRFDNRTGQSQNISPWPTSSFGSPISKAKYRFTWTSPVVFSPQDSHTLYMGSQFVLETRDEGASWHAISPDLTGCDPARKSAALVTIATAKTDCYGTVFTIAPSPVKAGVIWAGSDTGLIHLTQDGGKTWNSVTPPGLSDWSKVTLIAASNDDPATAYAAVDRHRIDDVAPYIYRTHDYGKTWAMITNGISAPSYVNAVREDSVRKGLLFAGTETGVYFSLDDGDHWQALQNNMPTTPVRDLVVHGDDLVIATHGRSFWIMDDITPLRQLNPQLGDSPAQLLQPQTAIRIRRDVGNDTPFPPEVPAGENPPAGAVIDYFLKSPPQGEVTLEILDKNGSLVRRFSSSDKPEQLKEPPPFAPYWLNPKPPLSKNAGLNRFVWDLRYPRPPQVREEYTIAAVPGQDTPVEPEGPLALPGTYTLRLSVNGETYSQPLNVKMDPRVNVSDADLRKQLDLALRISHAMQRNIETIEQAKKTSAQLRDLASKASPALRAEIAALTERVDKLMGSSPRGLPGSGLARLHGTLGGVLSAVNSADRAPTQQAIAVFQQTNADLQQKLSEWTAIRQQITALNAKLAQEKLPAIDP